MTFKIFGLEIGLWWKRSLRPYEGLDEKWYLTGITFGNKFSIAVLHRKEKGLIQTHPYLIHLL